MTEKVIAFHISESDFKNVKELLDRFEVTYYFEDSRIKTPEDLKKELDKTM